MPAPKKARTKPKTVKGGSLESPRQQLDGFLDKYTPEIAALARQVLTRMRVRCPSALQLVYDNYNALAIGFSPSERPSEAIFSIALYPRWVSLFFLQARQLNDRHGLLNGSGNTVRHIVLETADVLDDRRVQDLMEQAVRTARVPFDPDGTPALIVKSVSAQQRPRVPAAKKTKR